MASLVLIDCRAQCEYCCKGKAVGIAVLALPRAVKEQTPIKLEVAPREPCWTGILASLNRVARWNTLLPKGELSIAVSCL